MDHAEADLTTEVKRGIPTDTTLRPNQVGTFVIRLKDGVALMKQETSVSTRTLHRVAHVQPAAPEG